ncbi:hypothetical protein DPS35_24100 [Salmonella enterica subsp. diarizonae]|nr:hypothetical protein [Salmonella enterica subsp. diarizonae]
MPAPSRTMAASGDRRQRAGMRDEQIPLLWVMENTIIIQSLYGFRYGRRSRNASCQIPELRQRIRTLSGTFPVRVKEKTDKRAGTAGRSRRSFCLSGNAVFPGREYRAHTYPNECAHRKNPMVSRLKF